VEDDLRKFVVDELLDGDDSGVSIWENKLLADTVVDLLIKRSEGRHD
jgi:hypothetical protein